LTHRDPGFIGHVVNKEAEVVRVEEDIHFANAPK
jgi:hypothetical protein